MVSCTKTVSDTGAFKTENCQHLPLDRVFKDHFTDVRNPLNGGGKKRNRKYKGGSINYILDVSKSPIGGLTEVARHTTQPIYVDGETLPGKDMCGGKRRMKKSRSSKKYGKSKNHKKGKNHKKSHKGKKSKNAKKSQNAKQSQKGKKNKKSSKNKINNENKMNNENEMNKKILKKIGNNNNMNGGNNDKVGLVQDSTYTANMNERTFGCRQPFWDSKCT